MQKKNEMQFLWCFHVSYRIINSGIFYSRVTKYSVSAPILQVSVLLLKREGQRAD